MPASQYDIQIFSHDGSDWNENLLSIVRGAVITASADTNRGIRILQGSTEGHVLQVNSSGDLVFAAVPGGTHTQNTDIGTTSATFYLNTTGIKIKDNSSVLEARNNADNAYVNFKALGLALGTGGTVDTIETSVTDDDTHIPTSGAVVDYVGAAFAANDAMIFKGAAAIATVAALTTYNVGWTYRATDAGTFKSQTVEIGDLLIAIADRTGSGNVDADWTVAQTNIDGAVTGPASTVDNKLARFDGTTGKLIQDCLVTVDDSGSINIPTGQAYKINNVALAAADVGAASAYVTAPAAYNSTGTAGQVAWDGDYVYRCVATDSWRRAPMAKWA